LDAAQALAILGFEVSLQLTRGPVSPLVKHRRTTPAGKRVGGITRGTMLFFACISSGLAALIVAFVVLITVVGVYALMIWPLTFWDLANLGLEKYSGWTETIVLSVFTGGAMAGYWVFSGDRFKSKQNAKFPVRVAARFNR
jgi:hypothetical protein